MIFGRLTCILIVLGIVCASLLSCNTVREGVKHGITVIDEPTSFTNATLDRAEWVYFSMLSHYYESDTGRAPETGVADALRHRAEVMVNAVATPRSESEYVSLLDWLDENGDRIVDLLGGSDTGLMDDKETLRDLSAFANGDTVGSVIYETGLFLLDYKYEKQMEAYGKWGYAHLKEKADELLEEKRIAEEEIGARGAAEAMRCILFAQRLLSHGLGTVESLSNEEISRLLASARLEVNIGDAGWRLIAGWTLKFAGFSDNGYVSRLASAALLAEDTDALAESFRCAFELMSIVADSMDPLAVEALRKSERRDAVRFILAGFDDSEWELLAGVFNSRLSGDAYSRAAREYYGDEFCKYENNLTRVTLDELKASAGSADCVKKLEGYVAAVSAAFSYGMRSW